MIITGKSPLFIDCRAEYDTLAKGDGINHSGFAFEIILRHIDTNQRCYCWNELKKIADQQCKRCGGKGWLVFDKVHRVIKKKFIGTQEIATIGPMHFDSCLYFFRHDVDVVEMDVVREAAVDDFGRITNPVKIYTNLTIRDVERVKGNMGRVEFITCYANRSE